MRAPIVGLERFPHLRHHAATCRECRQRQDLSLGALVACGRRELASLYERLDQLVGA